MKTKVILFDFFGTLVFLAKQPSFPDLLKLLEKTGFSLEMAAEIADSFFSSNLWSQTFQSWSDFVRAVLTHWNKNPKEKLVQEIADFLEKNVIFQFYEDVKDVNKLPFRKAVLTDAPSFLLVDFSFDGFEKIFTPDNIKALKPDPRAFLLAIENLGVLPEETLMVGDDLEGDIIPAQKLGIKTILIDRENEIKSYSGVKINSLGGLRQILT